MQFFKPPKTDYNDLYDIMRFNFLWNLCFTIAILLGIVSVVNATNENYTSLFNIIEAVMALICVFILRKTRNYRLIAILGTLFSYALIALAYFTITKALHYTTPMWGILNVMFAFFMLGTRWGMLMLILQTVTLTFYFVFRIESNIANLPDFGPTDILNFILETVIVAAAIAYILSKFIKANKEAELNVKSTFKELKAQNKVITAQNKEKELMLKEIHHRVKNNLQVITSLLRLQSQEIPENQRMAFNEAINRVKSMALIHEKMYQSNLLANFDLESYLRSLTSDLTLTYSVTKPIELQVESDITRIPPENIVPISLIFNELISNSIKHAFERTEEGLIKVTIEKCQSEDHTICLYYSDNGTWKEPQKENSFGLELIQTMTEQLDGNYKFQQSDQGSSYSFKLKNQD